MKIVVAGSGSIGKNIISNFVQSKHSVVVIDKSREAVRDISGAENVQIILGDVCNPSVLEKADMQNTAGFISVTSSDYANLVACNLAKKLFKSPMTMALVKNDFIANNEHNKLYFKENFSVDHLLNPDEEIAQNLYDLIQYNDIYDYVKVNDISVFEIKCNAGSDISNTPIKHLKNIFPEIDMKIISILRNNQVILLPKQNDIILENDIVYVVTYTKTVEALLAAFGIDSEKRNIAIIGVNHITKCLIKKITDRNIVVVDSSEDKLLELSDANVEMRVLDSDPAKTLKGLSAVDTLIATMPDDDQNILLSLAARKIGINRVISFSHDSIAYNTLVLPQDQGIIVDFKNSVFSKILNILYIDEYIPLKHAEIAIFILDIAETSQYIGNSISSLFKQHTVMPLFVRSNQKLNIIDNDYIVHAGDRLILAILLDELKSVGFQNTHI